MATKAVYDYYVTLPVGSDPWIEAVHCKASCPDEAAARYVETLDCPSGKLATGGETLAVDVSENPNGEHCVHFLVKCQLAEEYIPIELN